MSLDDGIPWSVASFLEKDPIDYSHRDWRYLEAMQADACESVEAMETHWAGVSAQRPDWMDRVHWDGT